jgi:hypothetical protein
MGQSIANRVEALKCFLLLQYRLATWRSRCLPEFIVIGAQKCGTTSLHHYLSQHPQLIPAYKKGVHFFDGGRDPNIDTFTKGQAWYRTHFPSTRSITALQKTFEISTEYIFNPLAPKRIADLIPEVKLVAILRNPTERSISHYFHEKRKGRETLPLWEALQIEDKRLQPSIDRQDYKSAIFMNHSYKKRSLYYEQIRRYLDHFQRENLLIVNSEMFFTEPAKTLRRVYEFVGVDTQATTKDLTPRNVGSNKSEVDPAVYEYLTDYFRPHNQALFKLIGENFDW